MGKGSAPRPIPDRESFESNWDRIFGNKQEKQSEPIHNNDGHEQQGHSTGDDSVGR